MIWVELERETHKLQFPIWENKRCDKGVNARAFKCHCRVIDYRAFLEPTTNKLSDMLNFVPIWFSCILPRGLIILLRWIWITS